MINSIDFVKQKIDQLVIQFPSIKCSYEFDELDNTHSVEVLPSEFFNINEEFSIIENKIYEEFFELFPFEGLYFITDDVLVPITNPIYSKHGNQYEIGIKFNNADLTKGLVFKDTISYVTTNQPARILDSSEQINVFSSNSGDKLSVSQGILNDILEKIVIKEAGENNYALAA